MSRKKAIEAAMDEAILAMEDRGIEPTVDDAGRFYRGAIAAYEAGRIAGLREAVRMMSPLDNGGVSVADVDRYIRNHARELAKKARGK